MLKSDVDMYIKQDIREFDKYPEKVWPVKFYDTDMFAVEVAIHDLQLWFNFGYEPRGPYSPEEILDSGKDYYNAVTAVTAAKCRMVVDQVCMRSPMTEEEAKNYKPMLNVECVVTYTAVEKMYDYNYRFFTRGPRGGPKFIEIDKGDYYIQFLIQAFDDVLSDLLKDRTKRWWE